MTMAAWKLSRLSLKELSELLMNKAKTSLRTNFLRDKRTQLLPKKQRKKVQKAQKKQQKLKNKAKAKKLKLKAKNRKSVKTAA